jgi:hypothetical protein
MRIFCSKNRGLSGKNEGLTVEPSTIGDIMWILSGF